MFVPVTFISLFVAPVGIESSISKVPILGNMHLALITRSSGISGGLDSTEVLEIDKISKAIISRVILSSIRGLFLNIVKSSALNSKVL